MISETDRLRRLPSDVEDAYPLSRLQIGMFFHGDFEEGSTLYHDVNTTWLRMPYVEDLLKGIFDRDLPTPRDIESPVSTWMLIANHCSSSTWSLKSRLQY